MKPCPFCGCKEPRVSDRTVSQYSKVRHSVTVLCPTCHARGPRFIYHDDDERESAIKRAVDIWNRSIGVFCEWMDDMK